MIKKYVSTRYKSHTINIKATILNYSDFNKAVFARNEVKLNRIYLIVPQIWQWH